LEIVLCGPKNLKGECYIKLLAKILEHMFILCL